MSRVRCTCALLAFASVLFTRTAAGQLMIPDSGTGDRIMLFDSFDGSLIEANWITDTSGQFDFTTPKEAAVVGNQIWVTDQVADAVHRFDLSRNYLGSITTDASGATLDNIRGFGYDGTNAYLTRFHGTSSLRGVVTIDAATATATGFWTFSTTPSLFDAEPNGPTDLLISNSTSNNVERRDKTTGALVNNFATGITFPQQVATMSDGSIIASASIAAAGVEGIYHFNPDGSLRKFISTTGFLNTPRGGWLLGDGGYLIACDDGVIKAVETSPNVFGFTPMLAGVGAQYINPIPEPGSLSILALGGAALLQRRRAPARCARGLPLSR